MAPLAGPMLIDDNSFGTTKWEGEKNWSVQESSSLYKVDGWGSPYFMVNPHGNMAVRPHGTKAEEIDLMEAIDKVVTTYNISLPLIIRFPGILQNRMETLQMAFDTGIQRHGYEGKFQGVYPVKSNPDRFVVEDIVTYGRQIKFGLEAGSKPELLMVTTAMFKSSSESFVICNGYKDAQYVEMALVARQLGLKTIIVLEQEEELEIVLKMSKQLKIAPVIGIRAKLSTKHGGHWGETSGEKGKFGLSPSEIVQIVRKLRRVNKLDCLQLLHFHIGSQIPSLPIVMEGVSEAAQIFCELSLMGANMNVIDIGGGLGVDYDGTNSSSSEMSIGYTIEEYAATVVEAIKAACVQKKVAQPVLCCESGRALVSHHSVLVFDVLSSHKRAGNTAHGESLHCEGLPEDLTYLQDELTMFLNSGNHEGALDRVRQLKFECTHRFKMGNLNLEVRASIDRMFETLSAYIEKKNNQNLSKSGCGKSDYSATYHINLSIFKSMPDSWAIGQLFPIVPLHRLKTEPKERVIFTDLTCDSDGKVATFIGKDKLGEPATHLRVHEFEAEKPYYMGMFLGGAYQEVLGSMHNLFGNPHVAHVVPCKGGDGFSISRFLPGQNMSSVLMAMLHEPNEMFQDLKERVDTFEREGRLEMVEARSVLKTISSCFNSYTYLGPDSSSNAFSLNRTYPVHFHSTKGLI